MRLPGPAPCIAQRRPPGGRWQEGDGKGQRGPNTPLGVDPRGRTRPVSEPLRESSAGRVSISPRRVSTGRTESRNVVFNRNWLAKSIGPCCLYSRLDAYRLAFDADTVLLFSSALALPSTLWRAMTVDQSLMNAPKLVTASSQPSPSWRPAAAASENTPVGSWPSQGTWVTAVCPSLLARRSAIIGNSEDDEAPWVLGTHRGLRVGRWHAEASDGAPWNG
jgi:hypothetical protein